jgi:hypothetical protein
MEQDAAFLTKNNFMDYSLLMFIVYDFGVKADDGMIKAIEDDTPIQPSRLPPSNGVSVFEQELVDENGYGYRRHVYFGVIDYLTSFSFMKRFEEQWKGTFSSNSS